MARPILDRARRRLARLGGRFARVEDGAVALEFALVALPFLVLVFAIMELGMVFLVSVTLDSAVQDVGRTIRTGQVHDNNVDAVAFKTSVCNKMSWLGSNCSSVLNIDVQTFEDYAASNTTGNANAIPPTMTWNPGVGGSIVLIRAYYTWPLISPLMATGLQTSNGKRIIYAATAFTNEPF